jgi:hypothetical protein
MSASDEATIFICRDFACELPITNEADLKVGLYRYTGQQ